MGTPHSSLSLWSSPLQALYARLLHHRLSSQRAQCDPLFAQLPARDEGWGEGSRDYGAETAIFISTLIVLYLLAVVFLVRRQINQVSEDHDWDGERVVMTDREGKTNIRGVASLVEDKNEVLM